MPHIQKEEETTIWVVKFQARAASRSEQTPCVLCLKLYSYIYTHTSTRVSFVGRRLSNFQPTTTEKRPVVGTIETAATSVRPMFIDCLAALAQSEVDWIGFDVPRPCLVSKRF